MPTEQNVAVARGVFNTILNTSGTSTREQQHETEAEAQTKRSHELLTSLYPDIPTRLADIPNSLKVYEKLTENGGLKCCECSEKIENAGEALVYDAKTYCKMCVDGHSECEDCENCLPDAETFETTIGERVLCENCRNDYYRCDDCGVYIQQDNEHYYNDNTYCTSCYSELDREDEAEPETTWQRNYSTEHILDTEKGEVIVSPRLFSAEIECITQGADERKALAEALPDALGVAYDGSLNGDYGVEIQTPPMQGKRGELIVLEICKIAQKYGEIDDSCGLHIHLDAQGYNELGNLKNLWTFYMLFEDVLVSFLPAARRANSYCRMLKGEYSIRDVRFCDTVEDLEKQWYKTANKRDVSKYKAHKHHDSRYAGMNFHCYFASKNFEIRWHSGTLNAKKILHWIYLHTTILDRIADGLCVLDGNKLTQEASDVLNEPNYKKKTEIMYKILKLGNETKKYLTKRQKKFTNAKNDEVCVE